LVRLWPGWISQLAHISFRGAHTTVLQPEGPLSTNSAKMLRVLALNNVIITAKHFFLPIIDMIA